MSAKEIIVQEDDSKYLGSNLPVSKADLDQLSEQRKMLREFVARQLRVDVDYGVIPGTPKPSLYKPGAEKLTKLFGLGSRFFQTEKEVDRRENYASYTYKCEIYHLKTGNVIAECEAVCSSHEKKYKERALYEWKDRKKVKTGAEPTPIADIQNTLMKMAQKRAMVGATILACAASDFFTQDMEDYDDGAAAPIQNEEKKSQFEDDERTKKLNWLMDACRKVGISKDDVIKKYGVKEVSALTDAQRAALEAIGRAIHAGTKTYEQEFPA